MSFIIMEKDGVMCTIVELEWDVLNWKKNYVKLTCACGSKTETAKHYFMDCPLFIDERCYLVYTVTLITEFKLDTLLHGCPDITLQSNKHVFDAVHRYLKDTKQFE